MIDKIIWILNSLAWIGGLIWAFKISAPTYIFIIYGAMLIYCLIALGHITYYEMKYLV